MPLNYEDLYGAQNDYGHAGGSSGYDSESVLNNPLINNFATRGLLSGVQFIGETLGKPQAALFGALKGDFSQLANLIPFSDTLGITNTGDPNKGLTSERVGGRDLLRHYGMVDQEDNYGNFAGGLALDLLADPLAFVRGPLGALTKLGETAQKGAGLSKTIAGRMAAKEGGLFSITNKPWYAEMLPGAKKAENIYVAGVDDFLKKPMQSVAQGMESGWNKATEATIPGTNFSPLAWARSALEPGAANVSGHPQAVKTFGEHNMPRYNELVDKGAEAVGQTDILGKQADYLNKSADLGTDSTKAAHVSSQLTHYMHEMDAPGPAAWMRSLSGVPTDQIDLAKNFAKEASSAANVITHGPRQAALEVGYEVGDATKGGWQPKYFPRAKADSGNKIGTHAHARDAEFALAPGGKAMIEEMMIGPASGAKHITGLDVDQVMAQEVAYWTPHIQQEAIDRMNKVYTATAQNVPEELTKLTTTQGAAEYATKMLAHATELSPDVAKRGYYYRPDVGGELNSYAKNIAKPTAAASSAIQTLKEYAQDFTKMAGNNPTTVGISRLDDAMKEVGIHTGNAELAKRMGITEAELANYGVKDDLVQALKMEVRPDPTRAKSGWSKAVDAFRYGVTIPWPANLVRNWTSTLVDQGMVGTGATKGLGGASKIIRGAMTDPAEFSKWQPVMQKAIEHGVIGTDQVKALLGEGFDRAGNVAMNVKPAQVEKTLIESLKDFAKPIVSVDEGRKVGVEPLKELAAQTAMNPTLKKAAGVLGQAVDPVRRYMGTMETAHHFQNEVTRLQQFANLIDEGYSPAAAAKRVKVNQRDYIEGSTPFVRETLKNVIPFANFSLGNLKAQGDMLSRNTGRYSALMTLLNSGRGSGGFVPGYASSGAAIPLPGAEDGQQRFLGSLGLTQEDEMMSALASLAGFRGREAVRKFASGMNPLAKAPMEIATGTQIYSGRKLDDLSPSPIATLLTLGQSPDAARMLSSIASGTPAARAFSTVDRLADMERRGPIATLLNLSTGLRTVDVDQQAAAQIAARDTITKMLNASEQYKLREQLVVDPAWKGREDEMPPALQELWKQYQWLQQQGKAAVKEKQAAGR